MPGGRSAPTIYWTGKARYLVEHGRFPPIDPWALAAGKAEGVTTLSIVVPGLAVGPGAWEAR